MRRRQYRLVEHRCMMRILLSVLATAQYEQCCETCTHEDSDQRAGKGASNAHASPARSVPPIPPDVDENTCSILTAMLGDEEWKCKHGVRRGVHARVPCRASGQCRCVPDANFGLDAGTGERVGPGFRRPFVPRDCQLYPAFAITIDALVLHRRDGIAPPIRVGAVNSEIARGQAGWSACNRMVGGVGSPSGASAASGSSARMAPPS